MALGLHLAALSRRVLSRCRATTALPLRPYPLGTPEVLRNDPSLTQGRTFFSGARLDSFLDAASVRPGSDFIEITGPNGRLQSVHWPDRPDVFGPIGMDGLPRWVNWTRWPAVNPVTDQGNLNVCWAYSTVVSVEALNAIRTHHLVKLSEQQLIDCVKHRMDPDDALHYIIKNGGILADADYPYAGCRQRPQNIVAPGVTLDDCVYLTDVDEQTLKVLVAQQPVTATVGADQRFLDYQGGVINGPNYALRRIKKRKFGHSVTIVGYGELRDLLFWLIINSWDVDWGVWGFGFIARNTKKRGGAFGIAREIAYPVKVSPNNLFVRAAVEVVSSDESSEEDWSS